MPAQQKNQINIVSLWKFLNKPFEDHLEKLSFDEYIDKDILKNPNITEIFEALQSPKIHGDYKTEYVLVPLCSFGSSILKKCDLFKRQTTFYKKDQVCYTFNLDGSYQGQKVDHAHGFHFVINYKLPGKGEFQPVNLILHSSNEIPDSDNFPATTAEIYRGKVLRAGVQATIVNITSNFADMKESKRKCFLNIGSKANYSRDKCKMQEALKLAKASCNCIPWFMKSNLSVCDPDGLYCFDNLTMSYIYSNPSIECPQQCKRTHYSLSFDENRLSTMADLYDLRIYFGSEWSNYSAGDTFLMDTAIVHVNFIQKEATVWTKDARVTFADMLGTIGGTFGVFIGLSFLGILDFFIGIWNKITKMWSFKIGRKQSTIINIKHRIPNP